MKKAIAVFILLALCLALCACSPSPVAVIIGGNRVDASEVAFFINYSKQNMLENPDQAEYDLETTQMVKDNALSQIVVNELIRLKCAEYRLRLTAEQKQQIRESKQQLISSLGGMVKYVEYLRSAALTDRMYDKFQQNAYYYQLLYDYMAESSGIAGESDLWLKQYFSENYTEYKYIYFSLLDQDGNPLSDVKADQVYIKAQKAYNEARRYGANFDALIDAYSDDVRMSGGSASLLISRYEAKNIDFLKSLFDIKEGGVGGVYLTDDACYILKRLPLEVRSFEQNREMIIQNALDQAFDEQLSEWKQTVKVKTSAVFDRMTLVDYMNYVK